ncbi:hypothetical protein HYT26_00425 [Candidatus Pacearchaeota archaeon]|nr:hypothetical protein [Candidatus Pacearchaeota archaeon]
MKKKSINDIILGVVFLALAYISNFVPAFTDWVYNNLGVNAWWFLVIVFVILLAIGIKFLFRGIFH